MKINNNFNIIWKGTSFIRTRQKSKKERERERERERKQTYNYKVTIFSQVNGLGLLLSVDPALQRRR